MALSAAAREAHLPLLWRTVAVAGVADLGPLVKVSINNGFLLYNAKLITYLIFKGVNEKLENISENTCIIHVASSYRRLPEKHIRYYLDIICCDQI